MQEIYLLKFPVNILPEDFIIVRVMKMMSIRIFITDNLWLYHILLLILLITSFLGIYHLTALRRKFYAIKKNEENKDFFHPQNLLYSIINNIPDFIYVKDTHSRFILASKQLAKSLGLLDGKEMIGKTDHDFYPEELADQYREDEIKILNSGITIQNKIEEGVDDHNNKTWISTTKIPLADTNGNIVGIVGISRDISLQKEAEKKLIEKSEMLQKMNLLLEERQEEVQQQAEELQSQAEYLTAVNLELETLSLVASKTDNLIVIMDDKANFEWVNTGFEKRYNMNLEEFCRTKGKNLRITSQNPEINEIIDKILKEKKPALYNSSRMNNEGKILWSQTTISPVLDEKGNISRLIAIDSDITKLKEAEEQIYHQKIEIEKNRDELKKLNATKDKFLSIIAHDLKNPFHSIIGFSDLLSRSYDVIDKKKQLKFINLINDSSTSAYTLLENLLTWARSQTNRIQYNPENVHINSLISDNLRMMKLHAENKGISLEFSTNGQVEVLADSNMINTVFRNLISNAIKFTGKGGIIEIKTERHSDRLFVNVIDNGIGISKVDQEKLFKLESYHSTSGTFGEAGTGLGLIVCKDFVERHGGTLEVFSEEGKGSNFRFSLPLIGEDEGT